MSANHAYFWHLHKRSLIMEVVRAPLCLLSGAFRVGNSAFVYLITLSFLLGAVRSVPCFCTEDRCTYGYCESPWCLVGIRHNGRVIRTCGSESSHQLQPCLQDIGDWQDVCACTSPYCNTFAFLRYEIRAQAAQAVTPSPSVSPELQKPLRPAMRPPPVPPIVHFDRMGNEETTDPSNPGGARRSRKKGPNKDEVVVFERNDEKAGFSLRQSYLIVVLIVVPLSIAGTAIIVVILGYYCKMC